MRQPGPRERKMREELSKLPPPPEEVLQRTVDDLREAAALMAQVADKIQAGDHFAFGELGIHEPTRRLLTLFLAADTLATATLEEIRAADAKEN